MSHPLGSVAALKRALRPGATIRIVNHFRPEASRITVVLPKTNTVDLVTHAVNKDGKDVESHLPWPKRDDLRPDPDNTNRVDITREGRPFLTLTILEEA